MTKLVRCVDGPCAGESHVVDVEDAQLQIRVYATSRNWSIATYRIADYQARIVSVVPVSSAENE